MDLPVIHAEPSALRDAVYVLVRRRGRIAAVTLVVVASAYVFGVGHGAGYTATARLLAPPSGASQDHGQAARNEAEILRDPALLRALEPALKAELPQAAGMPARMAAGLAAWWRARAVQLGLAQADSADERLSAALSRALRVRAVPETDVVELRFTWPSPDFAAAVLNALLHDQQRLAAGDAEATQAVILATARLHDAEAQLAHIDAQLAALPSVDGGAPDAGTIEREKDRVASRIAAAHASADALRVERELAARKLDAAEKAYAGGGWVDNPDAPATATGAAPVDETFVDLLDKRAKLPPDSPKVHAIDQEIAAARDHAYQTVRQVLSGRLRGIDDRLAALGGQAATDEAEQRSLDDRLVQLEALQGSRRTEAALLAAAGRELDAQKRQAETALHQAAGLRVLSEASPPAEPDWPSPVFLLGCCAVGGFILGLASAVLAERRRITIDRPQDIARVLKIPVLASVPELR